VKNEMRGLLANFIGRRLTYKASRRASVMNSVDLPAAAYRQVFQECVAAGYLHERVCGDFELTRAGQLVVGAGKLQTEAEERIQLRNADESAVFTRQGFKRELIFNEADLGSAPLCLERVTLQMGEECVPHLHLGTHTVVYTLTGRVRVHYGDELQHAIEVGPSDCVFIPPGVIHYVVNEWPEPMTAVVARTAARHEVLEFPYLRPQHAADAA
jgi:uncharacterized RmlC-like cupin family protein